MIASLSEASLKLPDALTVLSAMIALDLLRIVLNEMAPPPLMAKAFCPEPAIETLGLTALAVIVASSDEVTVMLPAFTLTVELAIFANKSLLKLLRATEKPTVIAPALPSPEPVKAMATATAWASIVELSVAVIVALFEAPLTTTTLLLTMLEWSRVLIVLTVPTPHPPANPQVPTPTNRRRRVLRRPPRHQSSPLKPS